MEGIPRREVMTRSKWRRKKAVRSVMAGIISIVLLCSAGIFLCTELLIEPNLEKVAGIRAEAVVSRTINKALAEQFADGNRDDTLFIISKDEDGSIDMVQADSMKINVFMAELSVRLQEYFRSMENEKYSVPMGALLGSKVISQIGPNVDVTIVPMSISSMDFRTEFESEGINQTKYKIYIELDCRIRVLAPFSSEMFNTSSTILIAEAVILGDVPNSYVEVPKEDILDVIDE